MLKKNIKLFKIKIKIDIFRYYKNFFFNFYNLILN